MNNREAEHNLKKAVFWHGERWRTILNDDNVHLPRNVNEDMIRHKFGNLLRADATLCVLLEGPKENAVQLLIDEAQLLGLPVELNNPNAIQGIGAVVDGMDADHEDLFDEDVFNGEDVLGEDVLGENGENILTILPIFTKNILTILFIVIHNSKNTIGGNIGIIDILTKDILTKDILTIKTSSSKRQPYRKLN